jgi:hypothetical protein
MKTLARNRDKAEILRRLTRLRPDSVSRWGRMSAHQMVCHLNDSFRMATSHNPVQHRASLAQRTVIKWIALYLPMRWPTGLPTTPEIDQELGGTKPLDFAADLGQLESLVELTVPGSTVVWQPRHPVFGPMSEAAWLRWAYLHADHHLRQFGA